jgi:hypothetical protein
MHGPYFVDHSDPEKRLISPKTNVVLNHPINAKAVGLYCMDPTMAVQDRDAVMGRNIISIPVYNSPLMVLIEAKDTNATWFPKFTDSYSLLFAMQSICSCYGTKHMDVDALQSYTKQNLERVEAAEQAYYQSVDKRNAAFISTVESLIEQANQGVDLAVVLQHFADALIQNTLAEIADMEARIHAMFNLQIPLTDVQSRSDPDIDATCVLNAAEYQKMRRIGETAFGVKEMLCGSPENNPQWFIGDGSDSVEFKHVITRTRLMQYFRYLDIDNKLK